MLETFNRLESGAYCRKEALALSRVADIILQSAKTEIQYAKARNENPDIEFLKN